MENTEYSFNSNDLLYKVYRYRKPLLITTIIGFIAATIVSFCITPLYKSKVIIFPAPSLSTSQELIATQNAAKKESIFGEDKETEQILQVLNSDELRKKLISKYNLWQHYDIDSANISHPNDKMLKKFKKNISFRRTEYSAVEISVLDEFPDTAALIANDVAGLIDTMMNSMEKRRAANALNIVQYEYNEKVKQLKTFEDSLSQLMQKGVFDYESQSEEYCKTYSQAIADGNTKGAERIKIKMDTLAKYGATYISLRDFLYNEKEQLSMLNQKLKEAKVDAEQTLTHFFVVNKAIQSDKKAKPRRSIIILASTIATFTFSFVAIIFIELVKSYRKKEEETIQIQEE